MVYYVIPYDSDITDADALPDATPHTRREDAHREADQRHEATGDHFVVVAIDRVWSTKTLADLDPAT